MFENMSTHHKPKPLKLAWKASHLVGLDTLDPLKNSEQYDAQDVVVLGASGEVVSRDFISRSLRSLKIFRVL